MMLRGEQPHPTAFTSPLIALSESISFAIAFFNTSTFKLQRLPGGETACHQLGPGIEVDCLAVHVADEGLVVAAYRDYYGRYQYTFVNKSNRTNIRLNKEILYIAGFAENYTDRSMVEDKGKRRAPDFMRNNPLNADQVKALAEYCKGKNTVTAQCSPVRRTKK